MADRPILSSGPMVRAILDGRKTMTRRVLGLTGRHNIFAPGVWSDGYVMDPGNADWRARNTPYAVGDRLWVREAWNTFVLSQDLECSWPTAKIPNADPRLRNEGRNVVVLDYATAGLPGYDAGKGPWRPSIHMPRWASRLTLIVTDVRVQRLQDISEDDAIAEGVEHHDGSDCPTAEFEWLWNHINGPDAWDANPWGAAISFRAIHKNIDEVSDDD